MSPLIIVLCVAFAIGCIILGIAFWKSNKRHRQSLLDKHKAEIDRSASESRITSLEDQVQYWQKENKKLQDQIVESAKQLESVSNIDELINIKNVNQQHLDEINKTLEKKNELIHSYDEKMAEVIELIEKKKVELSEAEFALHEASEGRITLEEGAEQLKNYIYRLGQWYRKVLIEDKNYKENESTPGWAFNLTANEKNFIKTVAEVKQLIEGLNDATMISSLHQVLSQAEWKKIWMPKLQNWVKIYGLDEKTNCIYKLTLIADDSICYIGQAKDVKTRWYQHVKKMIGVDAKGDEKLYNFRPDEFEWSILEEDLSVNELNERESYWISFFGGDAIGLNKKA